MKSRLSQVPAGGQHCGAVKGWGIGAGRQELLRALPQTVTVAGHGVQPTSRRCSPPLLQRGAKAVFVKLSWMKPQSASSAVYVIDAHRPHRVSGVLYLAFPLDLASSLRTPPAHAARVFLSAVGRTSREVQVHHGTGSER